VNPACSPAMASLNTLAAIDGVATPKLNVGYGIEISSSVIQVT
jgi:hypothetical protein